MNELFKLLIKKNALLDKLLKVNHIICIFLYTFTLYQIIDNPKNIIFNISLTIIDLILLAVDWYIYVSIKKISISIETIKNNFSKNN